MSTTEGTTMTNYCDGHPAGAFDPMGVTVYCDGTCKPKRKRMRATGVRMLDVCSSHPDGERHECMRTEMRCAYCGARLDPYPCHGCGKFLTAVEMSGEGLSSEGTRCDECA